MEILIAGINGLLGQVLTRHFQGCGHTVTGLSRKASPGIMDWSTFKTLDCLLFDVIINLCGAPILGKKWTPSYKKELEQSRLIPAESIASSIDASKVKPQVLIQASAVGLYPPSGGPYTENSPSGTGFLSELCENWEQASSLQASTRRVILRTGVVLSKEGGTYPSLRFPFRFGLGGTLGGGKQVVPWIHVEDFCHLVTYAIEHPEISGPLNLVAPVRSSQGELAQAIAEATGHSSWTNLPAWVVHFIAKEASSLFLKGSEIIPQKAIESGFQFKFSSLQFAVTSLESRTL